MIEVSAIIPCLNEEKTLPICIEKIFSAFKSSSLKGEVIVADNGSSDKSVHVAQSLGARVVHVSTRGYGAALKSGIDAANGKIIVMADADDSYNWLDLPKFVSKLNEGYDFVIGNRFQGGIEPGAMPPLHRYLGNPVLSFLARMAFRVPVGDFHCGMRAFTKDAAIRMRLQSEGMEFATEMVACAARCKLRFAELPITLHKDKRDRPPHLRSFRDGWRHLRFILMYSPDTFYLVPGGVIFFTGALALTLLGAGPVTIGGQYIGIHYLALGALFTLVGYSIVWMGILAKVIMSIRFPLTSTALIRLLVRRSSLEKIVAIGLLLIIVGGSQDLFILYGRISSPGSPMDDTVHLAFAASVLIASGVLTIFNAFLLSLIAGEFFRCNRV